MSRVVLVKAPHDEFLSSRERECLLVVLSLKRRGSAVAVLALFDPECVSVSRRKVLVAVGPDGRGCKVRGLQSEALFGIALRRLGHTQPFR